MQVSKQVTLTMTDLNILVDSIIDPHNESSRLVALSVAKAVREADKVIFDGAVGGCRINL